MCRRCIDGVEVGVRPVIGQACIQAGMQKRGGGLNILGEWNHLDRIRLVSYNRSGRVVRRTPGSSSIAWGVALPVPLAASDQEEP